MQEEGIWKRDVETVDSGAWAGDCQVVMCEG